MNNLAPQTQLLQLGNLVYWDAYGINGPDLRGKPLRLLWLEIQRCEYYAASQAYLLKSLHGQTMWIPDSWDGVHDLIKTLEDKHPALFRTLHQPVTQSGS